MLWQSCIYWHPRLGRYCFKQAAYRHDGYYYCAPHYRIVSNGRPALKAMR